MTRRTVCGRLLAALAVGLAAGCGGDGDAPPAVSGSVTLDGAPVAKAKVVFAPADGGTEYATRTDADGRYEFKAAGPPAGRYRVAVTKVTLRKGSRLNAADLDDEQLEASGEGVDVLPKAYVKPADSPLTATVEPGANVIPLELKSR